MIAATRPTHTAPPAAQAVCGDRLELAQRFADRLAAVGVERGLIGPRELPRLWDRHLLNCALLTDLLPIGARVVDVGSGAGLPGLPMAIRRTDLRVDLVETMQRRTTFLTETVHDLGLGTTVRVVRGRVEDAGVRRQVGDAEWVVARAVAPLDRLARWCLPLLVPGGTLLAVKGRTVADEVSQHRAVLRTLGAAAIEVREVGSAERGVVQVAVVTRARAGRPR